MRDYVPDEEFTLEDILREFGSGPDIPPPEPVLPGMPEAFPELPEVPQLSPKSVDAQQVPQEEPVGDLAEAPKMERRRKPRQARKPAPAVQVSEDPYEDDFDSLEGEMEDYAFSLTPVKKEKKNRQSHTEKLPKAPQRARSAQSIVRDVELREKNLDIRLRICLVVTVVNLLLAVYHGIGLHWIRGFENVAALGVISLLLLLCAVGAAYDLIFKGLRQLGGSHYGAEAFLPFLSVAGIAEAIFAVIGGRLPFSALISINLLCALWAEQQQSEALRSAALILENASALHGVRRIEKAWQGNSAAARGEADRESFEAMLESDGPQKSVLRIYVPVAIVLSLLLAGLGALLNQVHFFWLWTALLLVASPVSCFLCYALPNGLLAERLARKKAALCGWYGARVLSRCEALFLRNGELFPEGSLKLSGVKVFGSYQSPQVMNYAAAVLHGAGCDAAAVLTMPGDTLPALGALRAYDEGGYSGEIGTDTVLVGTLAFLKRMGVHRESGARVRQALYVAINGELAGLVALRYEASTSVYRALKSLSGYGAPTPVISGGDVLITPAMLRAKFRLPLERLACPPLRERLQCAGITAGEEDLQGAVVAKGGLEPISAVCMGASALVTAVHTALVLSVLAGVVGMIVVFLLAVSNAMELVTCAKLFGFALIWGILFLIAALSVLKK